MKKILLVNLLLSFIFGSFAQNNGFIYVQPNGNEQIMYKAPDGSGSYTVLPKNTLYSISKLHSMSVDELIAMNGLSSNTIMVGQKLRVSPSSTVGAGLNIVGKASGEQANNTLRPQKLELSSAGELKVSADHPTMIRAEKLKTAGINLEENKGKHFEKEGELWYVPSDSDNFHTISYKYDMSFDSLRNMNSMNDYLYRKGMVLVVKPGALYGYTPKPETITPEQMKSFLGDTTVVQTADNQMNKIDSVEEKATESTEKVEPVQNTLVPETIEGSSEDSTEQVDSEPVEEEETIDSTSVTPEVEGE
jgi:LysM repeat protein